MKRQLPSQILEQQFFSLATRQAPLSESIQLGAQLMLQKAVELEVAEFLGREHYCRSGDEPLRGYRNGYEDKQVQSAEGPLHLKMPQVRNTIEAFESVWLQALVRRSDKLAVLIPQLYVKGLSTRDIEAALADTLEVEGVSKSSVSQLCRQLAHDFERWQNRDLSEHKILYLFCYGINLRLRPEDERAAAVLCAYGIREDGRKVLVHLAVQATGKGSAWVEELLQKAFTAATHKKGLEQAQGIVATYREQFPEAIKCLATDLEEVLTTLCFPESHRKRIRTTNLLERLFGEGKRRAKVIARYVSERSGLTLMFAVLVDASAAWRGVKITSAASRQLEDL